MLPLLPWKKVRQLGGGGDIPHPPTRFRPNRSYWSISTTSWINIIIRFGHAASNSSEMSHPAQTERQRARDGNEFGNEFSSYLSIPLQLKCFYPAGLICFLHSDLAGNLWGNGVGINPAEKPNVSDR